jgi:hypothetical protein
MNPHDPKRIVYPSARQYWRAFVYVMHLHENHCIKRAGVAGLRARVRSKIHAGKYLKKLFFQLMFKCLKINSKQLNIYNYR